MSKRVAILILASITLLALGYVSWAQNSQPAAADSAAVQQRCGNCPKGKTSGNAAGVPCDKSTALPCNQADCPPEKCAKATGNACCCEKCVKSEKCQQGPCANCANCTRKKPGA